MAEFKPVEGAENIPEAGATSITLPEVNVTADRIIEDRAAGIPWTDIKPVQNDRTAAGYQDPQALKDRLVASAVRNTALETPIEYKAGDAIPREIRHAYADAMVTRETIGPDEFSQLYHGAGHTPIEDLHTQLPDHADLTDHAIAIANDAGFPPVPAFVHTIKANLLDAWAETGIPPADLYTQAVHDPVLSNALINPPPPPPEPPEPAPGAIFDPFGDQMSEAAGGKLVSELGIRIAQDLQDLKEGIKGFPEEARKRAEAFNANREEALRLKEGDISRAIDIATNTGAVLSIAGSIRGMFQTPAQIEKGVVKGITQPIIREQTGLARQQTDQAAAQLEKYRGDINKALPEYRDWLSLDPAARVGKPQPMIANLIDYIEGRSSGAQLAPGSPFKPVADALRDIYTGIRTTIENDYPDILNSFYDDYYRHMWADPNKADQLIRGGRMGSSASVQIRTLPTQADGLAKGLVPRIVDPLDNTIHYVSGMRNFIAQQETLRLGREMGYVKYSTDGYTAPQDGWVRLKGRSSEKQFARIDPNTGEAIPGTQYAWAHPGYAGSYNNWVGKGFYEYPVAGAIYDKLQYGANMLTGLKLGMSGYHAFNIAQETGIAGLAKAIGDISRGELADGIKEIGLSATVAPKVVGQLRTGMKFQQQYLGIQDYGPAMGELTSLFARAGGRATGRGVEMIGNDSNAGRGFNVWNPTKWAQDYERIKNEAFAARQPTGAAPVPDIALRVGKTAALVPQFIGNTISGIMKPLFETAIPKIKVAAFADEMQGWLAKNPLATDEAKVAMARRLVDSMDDRFGELVQDNLFWPRWVKQSLNLATISVGWEFGTLRAFGGAAKDIASGQLLSPRARWLYTFPVMMGLMSSAYQYAKTGTLPTQTDTLYNDLLAARTGGTARFATGAQGQGEVVPERAQFPGYQKDPEQWYKMLAHAPDITQLPPRLLGYGFNKLSPAWRFGYGITTGNDPFTGDVIRSHADLPAWQDYANFVIKEAFTPIGVQTSQHREKGTNISTPERLAGLRPAGELLEATDAAKRSEAYFYSERQKAALSHERAMNKKLETPGPTPTVPEPPAQPTASATLPRQYTSPQPDTHGNILVPTTPAPPRSHHAVPAELNPNAEVLQPPATENRPPPATPRSHHGQH